MPSLPLLGPTSCSACATTARVSGLDMDYTEQRMVYWDSGESDAYSIKDYWGGLSRHEKLFHSICRDFACAAVAL